MKDLIELVNIVSKHKVKDLRTIDSGKKDRIHDFYLKLCEGELLNDEDAAMYYFESTSTHAGYRRLKNRLKERLLNSAIFIDTNTAKFSDAQKAFYACHKNLSIARILVGRSSRIAANDLLVKTLRLAQKFEIYEVARDTAIMLREHHAFRTGNAAKFILYRDLVEKYTEVSAAEDLASRLFQEAIFERVKSSANSVSERLVDSLEQLQPLMTKIDSFRFHFLVHNMRINLHAESRDYANLIDSCQNALDFFNNRKNTPKHFLAVFYVWRIVGLISTSQFDEGLNAYQEFQSRQQKYSVHWYNAEELHILLLFRSGQYASIAESLQKMISAPNLHLQTMKRQETVRLYEALLQFLNLRNDVVNPEIRTFRLTKFLNEIPIFSQDKRGYNITVLIIQILILLEQRKYDLLTDRIEAIEKYTSRYLRNDENFRSNCFIKMLLQIPKRNFHRMAVLRHAKPYIKRLASVPLETSKQSYQIEIIPYEHLWDYALESLK